MLRRCSRVSACQLWQWGARSRDRGVGSQGSPRGRYILAAPPSAARCSRTPPGQQKRRNHEDDIVTVSKALDHANVQIMLTTYAHAASKVRHGASDRMAVLLGQNGNNLETNRSAMERTSPGRVSQTLELAERVGFEPTNTREDVTGIPVQRLRPLGHLSAPVDILSGARRLHGGRGVRQTRFQRRAARPGPGRGRAGRTGSAAAAAHRPSGPCGPWPT